MARHYSPRMGESYVRWIERFIRDTAGKWIHPRDMTAAVFGVRSCQQMHTIKSGSEQDNSRESPDPEVKSAG